MKAYFNRVHASDVLDDNNNGLVWGIEWLDGNEVIECEWFATEMQRENEIDAFFKIYG